MKLKQVKIDEIDLMELDNITNYELSQDGMCPINCKQCRENKICLNCKTDYYLVGSNINETIICLYKDELTEGYYNNGKNIYYQCFENCEACSNGTTCDKCKDGFEIKYNNNKYECINISHNINTQEITQNTNTSIEIINSSLTDIDNNTELTNSTDINTTLIYINLTDITSNTQNINSTDIFNLSLDINSTDISNLSSNTNLISNISSELIIPNITFPEINETIILNSETINLTSINSYLNTTIDASSNIIIINSSLDLNETMHLSQIFQTQNIIDFNLSNTTQMISDVNTTGEIIKTYYPSTTELIARPEIKYYIIFVVQTQIINNTLYIFIITDFDVKIGMNFTFKIVLFNKTNNLRVLENKMEEINVTSDKDYTSNELITLKSQNNYIENNVSLIEDEIDISHNEDESIQVTSIYNNNKKMLNTKSVEELIQKNSAVDLSKSTVNNKSNIYTVESATSGCNFNLLSTKEINSNIKSINLTFIGQKSDLIANCDLKNNEKNINCNINKEANGNYTLKTYQLISKEEIFTIVGKASGLKLSCSLESEFEKLKSKIGLGGVIGIILGVIFGGALIICLIIFAIYRYCKNAQKKYKNYKFYMKRKSKARYDDSGESSS